MAKKVFTDRAFDLLRAFEQVPKIMGLDLTRKRSDVWWGGYYLDGSPHPYRKDKMKVAVYNRNIWVHEEGGQSQSIATWLVNNGRAADYADAYRILDCKSTPLDVCRFFEQKTNIVNYVPRSVVEAMAQFDLKKCPLFRWMCTLFPEDRVREVWKMYNVTTDTNGYAVFWYVDASGRVAFDKRIAYREDGHRDKNYFPPRAYRSADGFTARPYFGAHLVSEEPVNIVESEKSCLLATRAYGGIWVATGGKNNLKKAENARLYPDIDAASEWAEKGPVVEWWENWNEVGSTSDIGDMIVWNLTH